MSKWNASTPETLVMFLEDVEMDLSYAMEDMKFPNNMK